MSVLNLDAACARLGAQLGAQLGNSGTKAKDTENSLTKSLGVLEEQGVYAIFLYLHAREKDWGRSASDALAAFLREQPTAGAPFLGPNKQDEPFGALQELAEDVDKLLFARDLLHRVLVYARYHAKAAQKTDNVKPNETRGAKS